MKELSEWNTKICSSEDVMIGDILSGLNSYFRYKFTGLPNTANYDITAKCNSDCLMCYFKKNYNYNSEEFTTEEWTNIFLSHNKSGIKNAFLTGGEPLLRMDVIEKADKIFKSVWIVSNGIIKLPSHINRRVFISIDGTKETHNYIRGVKSFDKIIENITNDRRVIIAATLSTENYQEIRDLVNIARESKVHGITFSMCTGTNIDDPLVLSGYKLHDVCSELKYVLKNNPDIVLLTDKMIDNFIYKPHLNRCLVRSKFVVSYYPNMQLKFPCVLGENVSCSTCGCIVPIMMDTVVYQHDFSGLGVLKQMYPSRMK